MTAEYMLPESRSSRKSPIARRIHAISPEPDVMAELAAEARTVPLRAIAAEKLHSHRPTDRSMVRDRGSRSLASRAWDQRSRLVVFGANGINVFAVGLLIQVILVRYAGMGPVTSYIAQTILSVQLSFLLSRYLTWRDRNVPFLWSIARFNVQQLTITGLGMAGYVALEQLDVNYIMANVAVTAVLAPVSFLSCHKWSLAESSTGIGEFLCAAARWRWNQPQYKPSPENLLHRICAGVCGIAAADQVWTLAASRLHYCGESGSD